MAARRARQRLRDRGATATQNGYTDGVNGVSITSIKDPSNNRRLWVTISAPVNTFFMKIFGIQSPATRMSKAEYVLPVPMGSPENYYGNFGLTRGLTSTSTSIQIVHNSSSADSGWALETAAPTPTWTASSGTLVNSVTVNDNIYAQTTTASANQQWSTFGLTSGLAANQTVTAINGIEVRLSDTFLVGRVREQLRQGQPVLEQRHELDDDDHPDRGR